MRSADRPAAVPPVFRVELLPARHGDCLLVEYGDPDRPDRILIDGGPIAAWPALERRLQCLPDGQRAFELMVVTHIDADHIEGAIKLLAHPELATFGNVWFNGWPQLDQPLEEPAARPTTAWTAEAADRSAGQGLALGSRITGSDGARRWNAAFDGGPVFAPAAGALPRAVLPGGMVLTLLGPPLPALVRLRSAWSDALVRSGIDADDVAATAARLAKTRKYRGDEGDTGTPADPRVDAILAGVGAVALELDNAVANGSSIAFVAEYAGRRCAFLGDAHMPATEKALQRLADEDGTARVRLDAVKLAHHGSAGNLSPRFLSLVDCRDYLVSTDGSIFGHPDDAAIRLLVTGPPGRPGRPGRPGVRLHFNYRSPRTAVWDSPVLQRALGFEARYPTTEGGGQVVDMLATGAA